MLKNPNKLYSLEINEYLIQFKFETLALNKALDKLNLTPSNN